MNISFMKLTQPIPKIAEAFNKWENNPALIPFIRPNQAKDDLDRREFVTIESLRQRLEHDEIYLIYSGDQLVGEMNYQANPKHLYKKEPKTAWIGITRSELDNDYKKIDEILEQLQGQLSIVMAFISSYQSEQPFLLPGSPTYLSIIEGWTSRIEEQIKVPNVFLKAGKTKLGAYFNLLRVISRRVERKAVADHQPPITDHH